MTIIEIVVGNQIQILVLGLVVLDWMVWVEVELDQEVVA